MGVRAVKGALLTAKVGTGLMYRVTAKSLFKKGLTYQGPGLIKAYGDLDDIQFYVDVFRLGHYIHTRDPVEGSSSQTYQQNGGPSALHERGRPVPVVKPAAKFSAHGGGRSGAKPRRKRCPPGHRWNGSRCVRIRS